MANFLKKMKDVAISTFVATSKVQESLSQNLNLNSGNDIQHEQQVRKQEINLLSKKKFYQILEAADSYSRNKFSTNKEVKYRSFINKHYFNYENGENISHLKTNNKLGDLSELVNVHNEDGYIVLEFVINHTKNFESKLFSFDDLEYLNVVENAKTFSYDVVKYLGTTDKNQFERSYYFQANVVMNGEYDFEMDDSERILDVKNTPPKDRFYL